MGCDGRLPMRIRSPHSPHVDHGSPGPALAPGRRTLTASLSAPIQRKASVDRPPSGARELDLDAPRASGGLPAGLRAQMEQAFGADFASVRVHESDRAASLGAVAYAQGDDLHFSPGSYRPDSASGRELIGHELAHVVQQRAGRVAVPQGKGAPVNADPALEAEADALGARAAAGERVHVAGATTAASMVTGQAAIQGKFETGHLYQPAPGQAPTMWDGTSWVAVPPGQTFRSTGKVPSASIGDPAPGTQLYAVTIMGDATRTTYHIREADADNYALWDLGERPTDGTSAVGVPNPTRNKTHFANVDAYQTEWQGGTSRMSGFGLPASHTINAQQQWRTEVTWGSLTDGMVGPEGTKMEATRLGPDHPMGCPPDADRGKNAAELSKQSTETWIAGHMLNDNLGGSGIDDRNIVAFPHTINMAHKNGVEKALKSTVNDQGKWVYYRFEVLDHHQISPTKKHAKTFETEWYELDHNGGRGGPTNKSTFNVPKITEVDAKKLDNGYAWEDPAAPDATGATGESMSSPIYHNSPYGAPLWSSKDYAAPRRPTSFPDTQHVQEPFEPTLLRTASNTGKSGAEIKRKIDDKDATSVTFQLYNGALADEAIEHREDFDNLGKRDQTQKARRMVPSDNQLPLLETEVGRERAHTWRTFGMPMDQKEFDSALRKTSKLMYAPMWNLAAEDILGSLYAETSQGLDAITWLEQLRTAYNKSEDDSFDDFLMRVYPVLEELAA
jgi:hypothetical protein